MSTLKGKKVILGVTGGIAAYKAPLIVRELVKKGAEVRVVMTPSAKEFVTALTLETVSNFPVISDIFDPKNMKTWHIEYAQWADCILIAPATVNSLAKFAYGIADNPVTTVFCAARSSVVIAPAADMFMYNNVINIENIKKLESRGAYIVKGERGFLASGLEGDGRMAAIDKIVDAVEVNLLGSKKDLIGRKILVTAGPTYEDIDPVRFIGNRSTGKMGYEIAKAAFLRGAEVTLISGPSNLSAYQEINVVKVRSANEMKDEILDKINNYDSIIMSAAVADFRPAEFTDKKIKKENNYSNIELVKNDDILSLLNSYLLANKLTKIKVGFALETDNEMSNAKDKMSRKNLDMIVLNSLNDSKSGFEFDTNSITIFKKNSEVQNKYPLASKFVIANNILDEFAEIK